jgi:hypothetical protein
LLGLTAQPRHGILIERPERIGRGCEIVAGLQGAVLVAARHQHQSAIERKHLVEEHRDVHRARLRHAVVARPGAVVLVPLPDVTLERRLGVELELMNVDILAEHLPQRLDQARVMRQQAEDFVVLVRREGGARRAVLLAPDLLAVLAEDVVGAAAHQGDFLLGEAAREEAVALIVELADLLCGQFHRRTPSIFQLARR